MADLGGFPIIGSGQGIIKYFAVLPLFLFLFYRDKFSHKQLTYLNFAPVAMVLLWIGGMKFFEFEANAIVGLVETSPFMSWLYDVFSVQGASNVIGGFDVLFALLLGVGIYTKNKPMIIGPIFHQKENVGPSCILRKTETALTQNNNKVSWKID